LKSPDVGGTSGLGKNNQQQRGGGKEEQAGEHKFRVKQSERLKGMTKNKNEKKQKTTDLPDHRGVSEMGGWA